MSQTAHTDRLSMMETRLAVIDFYHDYADVLDSGRYDEWPGFFMEDGLYRIVPRENFDLNLPIAIFHCEGRGMLRDRVTAVKETMLVRPRSLRHYVTGIRVLEANGEVLHTQANVLLVESLRDQLTSVVLAGRYIDQLVRKGERLLLKERVCVYDSSLLPTSLVAPV
jgi:anthranilate 1,2-dioxygenase small subunit